ncbi:BRO family protein [Pseudochrobactrum sp. Wa41.01b-1]|uniref:BRO-N domain-containing protein n=1 Tax=Pseudochrobactrum sp. Wa41.01b-1 TaxID=2864102 RepID=UPI001C68E606|nr:BRO family protein [Pseudochrobactrum sp. Wa41.01b-1]QYM73318.1 BRO family protein [Pseudochrobactrum sp. Wa41.01b-1]
MIITVRSCRGASTTLTTFNFNSNEIRVVTIDDQPWFVATDTCRALEMPLEKGSGKYLSRLMSDEKRPVPHGIIGGKGMKQATLFSESGLYKLILRSTKPEAQDFQNWVTRVVLPVIRKDGAYITGEEKVASCEMDEDEFVLRAMTILQGKVDASSSTVD